VSLFRKKRDSVVVRLKMIYNDINSVVSSGGSENGGV